MADSAEKRFPESKLIEGGRREISRLEPSMRSKILDALSDGPKTIPEISRSVGGKQGEVMWWVMGCWRYGYIAPTGEVTDDGYYKYEVARRKQ